MNDEAMERARELFAQRCINPAHHRMGYAQSDCIDCLTAALLEFRKEALEVLEDKLEEWRNECMNLRQQLAAKDKVICGMRELIDHFGIYLSEYIKTNERDTHLEYNLLYQGGKVMMEPSTCPHKERN